MATERISHVGLLARSPEGHAAKGMAIKGHEDLWVEIQANTFRNWVNENLRSVSMEVRDLATDLADGTRLCALVEVLQKRPLRPSWNKRPANPHHFLENVATALKAIEADGVKLVNIGNVDIVNGNLKLILGLIWSLIVRYQIGRSKFPPRKLMLAWLKAVLPECRVHNFTTDWNSGVCLSALLEYCRPGLFPHWKHLDSRDSIENCRAAMELARSELNIPMVLEPEYLASPFLDELSGMTYLSYFMKEDSPGFHATLRWINSQIPEKRVNNFTTDWNDGTALCALVRSLGGPVPGFEHITTERTSWESNLTTGIHGGEKLGVEPILKAKDMADKHVEHLGVMAYAAHFQWIQPRGKPGDRLAVHCDLHTARVNKLAHFNLELLSPDVDPRDVTAEVVGPGGTLDCRISMTGNGGKGTFTPTHVGMHQLLVYNEGELVRGSPFTVRVMPEQTSILYAGMEPCAIGSIVEVLINSNGAHTSLIDVYARSPTGRNLPCPVQETDGVYAATFQPDEAGEWSIAVTHRGQHIQGGPFTCFVFDPNGVKLIGFEGAQPGQPFSFTVDATETGGLGEICVDIVSHSRSVPHRVEALGNAKHRVSFTPTENGKYRVYVYFLGSDVRGSPFTLRVGSQRSRDKSSKRESYQESSKRESYQESSKRESYQESSKRESQQDKYQEWQREKPAMQAQMHYVPSERIGSGYASPTRQQVSPDDTYWRRRAHYSVSDDRETTRSPITTQHLLSSPALKYASPSTAALHTRAQTDTFYQETMRVSSPVRGLVNGGLSHTPSPIPNTFRINSASPGHSGSTSPAMQDTKAVDTSSNVRVSAMLGGANTRSDAWDAIAKTKSMLSYGSLESLANLANKPEERSQGFSLHDAHRSQSQYSKMQHTESRQTNWESPSTGGVAAIVTGEALKLAAVNRQSTLNIELDNPADLSQVTAQVTAPSGHNVPVQLFRHNAVLSANFTATEIGEHVVDVRVRDQRVSGAPFRTQAYNARAIQVGRIPDGVVGQPVEFHIDGSGAGSGNLEILVNGGHVTSFVRNLGNQRFLASFVPHEALSHLVDMRFNSEAVQGSPWQVGVMTGPKMSVLGEAVRLVPAGATATFELSAVGFTRDDVDVQIVSPSKRPVTARLLEEKGGEFRVEFTPSEVGSHLVEVSIGGQKLPAGPLVAKVYNSALIKVTDVGSGVVGQPCQFRVDASQAGEGQLEISINEGEVPNHVQVVGGGKCLVSFTPEQTKPHLIDIKFNGETVTGCPYTCSVSDTSRVSLTLRNLELVAVNEVARFHMGVDGSGSAELAVAVRGPTTELPVKVTGNIHSGFTAEFTPRDVGAHSISVEYNGHPVSGTPFVAKAYDAKRVFVGPLPKGSVGKTLQFMVDASQAGEGNLEITISARGHNIPTQVHPQGNARFAVSFVPIDPTEHVISINFNKESVPGSPFTARVQGDSSQILVSGSSLNSAGVGKTSFFTMSNVSGNVEDIEVNVEGSPYRLRH